jgi:NAD(P)-dependent dehydrogenase (short-subunit alcohol dehydrogenase family)
VIQGAALVTGAGDRLGRAMAVRLAEMGLDVAVHYGTNKAGAEETVRLIERAGQTACVLQADLTDMDQAEALVDQAVASMGQLSVLINNASVFEYDNLSTATRESWSRHINSNLHAPFVLTQAFAAQAPEAGTDDRSEAIARACVVNMVDQRVRKLTPEFMTYTIAKMGLWVFTQTAAQSLAPNIRVNAIGPGPTLQGTRQSDDHFTKQRAGTVLERGSNPEEIVAAMEYLVKSPAITGQLICVDGGQHLGWKTRDIIGI